MSTAVEGQEKTRECWVLEIKGGESVKEQVVKCALRSKDFKENSEEALVLRRGHRT